MTLSEAQRRLRERLDAAGVASPAVEAARLLEALTGLTPSGQLLESERELTPEEGAALEAWTRRREAREPLQHIVGTAGFYGLDLTATAAALIPRPETEVLVALALEVLDRRGVPSPRLLDIGTGSGAIALALKRERPDAEVWATDVSQPALDLARINAERLDLDVRFARADLLDGAEVAAFARSAHLLVSNPPYLPEGDRGSAQPEVAHDPPEALYSGVRGLDLFARLERSARALLRPGATLLVELDPRNVDEAQRLAADWAARSIERDLAGRKRFLHLVR